MTIKWPLQRPGAAFPLCHLHNSILKDSLKGGRGGSLVGMVGELVVVIWTLELLRQELTQAPGHRILAAAQCQTIHLCLSIGLQSQQTANLLTLGLDHTSTNVVLGIWINIV